MSGIFVVLEGIDGSGKSTAALEIHNRLNTRGIGSVVLREPTEKTDASREIRRILKTVKSITPEISGELNDLFLIDRLWDIDTQIKPALRRGNVVLLDRYFLSTAAYQADSPAGTAGIMEKYLGDHRILMPDIILYLELPVKTALSRLGTRRELDVFESEARLSKIAERYRHALEIFRRERPAVRILEEKDSLAASDFDRIAAQIA